MTNDDSRRASAAQVAVRKIMEHHDLLGQLRRDEMDEFIDLARTRHYSAGHLLFSKGDSGDSLFAVLEGQVRISILSERGQEVVLNILGQGEIFGEIALLDGKERTASASTIGNCTLVTISRRDFLRFLDRHPQVAQRMLQVLCARLRWVSESYEDAMFRRLPNRLAKRVLFLAENFGESCEDRLRISVSVSQQELGNMVGVTRESINKQLRQWERAGLVTYADGHITILDVAEFSRIAEHESEEQ